MNFVRRSFLDELVIGSTVALAVITACRCEQFQFTRFAKEDDYCRFIGGCLVPL
jgi:hypothetical protein